MIKRTYETASFIFHSQDEDGDFGIKILGEPTMYVARDELKDIRDAIDELLAASSK